MAVVNRRARPRLPSAHVRAIEAVVMCAVDRPAAALSLWMTGDADLHDLNRRHRGRDKTTDVLSFPHGADDLPPALAVAAPVGDVAVNYDAAWRQARAAACPLAAEVARLVVHGVLHCLGHDHVHGGRQAARMRREEARLFGALAAAGLVGAELAEEAPWRPERP